MLPFSIETLVLLHLAKEVWFAKKVLQMRVVLVHVQEGSTVQGQILLVFHAPRGTTVQSEVTPTRLSAQEGPLTCISGRRTVQFALWGGYVPLRA